jgi:hypothetical protein
VTAKEIAALLGCDDLKVGQSRKVSAPYRDDETPSLNVTRTKTTFLFHDHGYDGDTHEALVSYLSRNGHVRDDQPSIRVRPRRRRVHASDDGPLSWYESKTGLPREFLATLDLEEDGDHLVYVFRGLAARKVRAATDEKKQIHWEGAVIPPPLWPIPGETLSKEIVLCEGESDACTYMYAGFEAYSITLGASSDLTLELLEALRARGAQHVTLAGDADDAGVAWTERHTRLAHAAGLTTSKVELRSLFSPFGSDFKDANDLWRTCDSIEDFREAIAKATVTVETPADETRTLDEFLTLAEREIPWLIEDLLARGEIALIAAPQKTYKTWVAIVMIRALATGTPFLQPEWRSTGRHRILVVEEEGNEVKFAQRFRTADFEGDVAIRFRKGSDLTSREWTDALIAQIQEFEYDVLVLDPLQRMAPGVNENDAGEMGLLWDNVHRIARECPTLAIILLHHFNKGAHLGWQGIRGSSRTGGEVDVAFFLEKQEGGGLKLAIDGRDIPQYLDASEALDVSVEIDASERVMTMEVQGTVKIQVRKTSKVREAIEQYLCEHEGARATTDIRAAVAEALEEPVTRQAVSRHLNDLEEEGLVAGQVGGARGAKAWAWVLS